MTSPGLVADLGGTNVRFALTQPGTTALVRPGKFASRQFASLADAAKAYLGDTRPDRAVFAVAGPVEAGRVHLTNLGWELSEDALAKALGIAQVRLINDFEAIALSLPHLAAADLLAIGPEIEAAGALAVVGPGTGFGVAGWANGAVLVAEGGHADFAPADETEIAIWKALHGRFGHVSLERLLSGPGLVNLYQALGGHAALAAEEITARRQSDPLAHAAFERFCAILGTAAGNIALTLGARGGVYIAGGILPPLRAAFAASAFRMRFEAKGRFAGYMRAIPTRLIVQDQAGMIGAAAALRAMPGPMTDI